jgi:hypothetical protein
MNELMLKEESKLKLKEDKQRLKLQKRIQEDRDEQLVHRK